MHRWLLEGFRQPSSFYVLGKVWNGKEGAKRSGLRSNRVEQPEKNSVERLENGDID